MSFVSLWYHANNQTNVQQSFFTQRLSQSDCIKSFTFVEVLSLKNLKILEGHLSLPYHQKHILGYNMPMSPSVQYFLYRDFSVIYEVDVTYLSITLEVDINILTFENDLLPLPDLECKT